MCHLIGWKIGTISWNIQNCSQIHISLWDAIIIRIFKILKNAKKKNIWDKVLWTFLFKNKEIFSHAYKYICTKKANNHLISISSYFKFHSFILMPDQIQNSFHSICFIFHFLWMPISIKLLPFVLKNYSLS